VKRLAAPAIALALCALAGCGGHARQVPQAEDPALGELRERVAALEKTVRGLQEQPKPPAKLSTEERLVGNWVPKQAGRRPWLDGLRLEADRTCRFTLHDDDGPGEALRGTYAVVGQQIVIDVPGPAGKVTHQWGMRSLAERSVILRRVKDGKAEEVRLERE
jgi:hypothetical protein